MEVIRFLRVSALPGTAHSRRRREDGAGREFDGFHHLADEAIGEHDDGIAVLVGEVEGQGGEVGHLLHGIGREHEGSDSCRGRRP